MQLTQPRKLLLLDLDGVVLRHPGLSKFVKTRAEHYVQRRLHISLREAEAVNTALYTKHGHTWKGLQTEFGEAASGVLADYNHFVYDWNAMDRLRRAVRDPEMRACRDDMKALQAECAAHKAPIWIFSNAPMTWCLPVLSILDVDWGLVLSVDNPLLDGNEVKPSPLIYGMVNNFIEHTIGPKTQVLFVDDSMINLEEAIPMPRWQLFHFAPGNKRNLDPHPMWHRSIRTINDLQQMSPFLV